MHDLQSPRAHLVSTAAAGTSCLDCSRDSPCSRGHTNPDCSRGSSCLLRLAGSTCLDWQPRDLHVSCVSRDLHASTGSHGIYMSLASRGIYCSHGIYMSLAARGIYMSRLQPRLSCLSCLSTLAALLDSLAILDDQSTNSGTSDRAFTTFQARMRKPTNALLRLPPAIHFWAMQSVSRPFWRSCFSVFTRPLK